MNVFFCSARGIVRFGFFFCARKNENEAKAPSLLSLLPVNVFLVAGKATASFLVMSGFLNVIEEEDEEAARRRRRRQREERETALSLSLDLLLLLTTTPSSQLRLRPRRSQDALRLQRHGHGPLYLQFSGQKHRLWGSPPDQLCKVGVGDDECDVGFVFRGTFGDFLLFARAELEGPFRAVNVEDDETL